jgi:uncharacterized membrane protein YgcG
MPLYNFKKVFSAPKGRSGGETFLRFMLLIVVFVAAGWLYTKHFDRTIETIQQRASVFDETGRLSDEQKVVFREFGRMMRDEFGVEVRIHAVDGAVPPPETDNKTLFFGVNTKEDKVVIDFPPLVAKALENDFIAYLRNEHFGSYFEQGNWPKGLAEAMKLIWERLTGIETPDAS